jgi:hypothetical protein
MWNGQNGHWEIFIIIKGVMMSVMTREKYAGWLYSCCRTEIVDGFFHLNGHEDRKLNLDALVTMSIDGIQTGDEYTDKDTFILTEPVCIDYEHIKLEYPFKSVRTGNVELMSIHGVVYIYPWNDAFKQQAKLLDLMRVDRNIALLHSKSKLAFDRIVAKWHLENTHG